MEMHQIRYFLAVCETLNFTRAAERCNVAQPSLTRAIKGLEDELGGQLFRRERNNTHLTGLGEMMRPHLAQVLTETEAAKERARSFAKAEDTELRVGLMCTIGPGRLLPFLRAFRDRHPGIALRVSDGNAATIADNLAKGGYDVAIYAVPGAVDERFQSRRLYDERFVIGVAPGHAFERQNAVRLADLDGAAYVCRAECEFDGYVSDLLGKAGIGVRTVFRSDRDDWVQTMALTGLGFTYIPEHSVTLPGLCVRPLIEPEIARTVQISTVRGRPHLPAVGAFVNEALRFPWNGPRQRV
ncbi:MAG: LysR family transcriptional regulator [Rhodospirillales bacterium]|nr:LysR family transcriptional regulator [Rhodospirillales bacterium]QQS14420.1 MAG: LysR family transcriptional regulator [Rhodospirillales bacterium]